MSLRPNPVAPLLAHFNDGPLVAAQALVWLVESEDAGVAVAASIALREIMAGIDAVDAAAAAAAADGLAAGPVSDIGGLALSCEGGRARKAGQGAADHAEGVSHD